MSERIPGAHPALQRAGGHAAGVVCLGGWLAKLGFTRRAEDIRTGCLASRARLWTPSD